MEERTILIANTKTQQRHELHTSATTLGELKVAMMNAGIDYSGMDFTEGISKTHLLGDDTQLPSNVMFRGAPTNNLVMLLTNTTKNIASGCGERSRKEAYAIINEVGEAAKSAIQARFGKNYTQVKTVDLWDFIDNNLECNECDEIAEEEEEKEFKSYASHPVLVEWVYDSIKVLVNSKNLYTDDVEALAELITEYAARLKEGESFISDRELDDMISKL